MKAVVVYESLWGNTAAIAHAIAEGLGPNATALATDEATAAVLADADLVVAGAPLLGFNLPTDDMRASIGKDAAAPKPDLARIATTALPAVVEFYRAWAGCQEQNS